MPDCGDDQPLAGIVGRGDRRHVALVKQRHLHGAALGQGADLRSAQRGDPIEPGGSQVLGDAGTGDQAAIADQNHMVEAKALFELFDLGAEGGGIGGVAVKHLDRDRAAIGRAQQAIDDLRAR